MSKAMGVLGFMNEGACDCGCEYSLCPDCGKTESFKAKCGDCKSNMSCSTCGVVVGKNPEKVEGMDGSIDKKAPDSFRFTDKEVTESVAGQLLHEMATSDSFEQENQADVAKNIDGMVSAGHDMGDELHETPGTGELPESLASKLLEELDVDDPSNNYEEDDACTDCGGSGGGHGGGAEPRCPGCGGTGTKKY